LCFLKGFENEQGDTGDQDRRGAVGIGHRAHQAGRGNAARARDRAQQKLAIVRAALEAAFGTFKDLEVRFEEVWPTLAAMIASVVAVFNSRGVFKKELDAPE
jgi:hypothetical protein